MRKIRLLSALGCAGLVSCASAGPLADRPPHADAHAPTAPAPVAAAGASAAASSAADASYSGHGTVSLPPEVLAEFPPKALPSDASRRIQAMLDVRAPGAGALSPDGKALFFSWNVTGVRQLWRLDGPQRFPVQLTGGEDPTVLADVTPDGKALLIQRDRAGEENPGLYVQSPSGGPLAAIQHLAGVQTTFELVSDDSRHVYFRSNDRAKDAYAIYRWDLGQRKKELVFAEPGLWNVADERDGKLLLDKMVGGNQNEYYELDTATMKLTPLFGQGEREEHLAAYGAKVGEIIVSTPKLGEFRRLYRFVEGKLTPVSPELQHDVASFSIDRQRTRILYTVNEGGYSRLRGMDARSFAAIELPKLPTADHTYIAGQSRDGRVSSFAIETATAPSRSFTYEWQAKKLVEWHVPSAPEIDTARFSPPVLESYPARDGTAIPMFVRRPSHCAPPRSTRPSAAEPPCPVVVQFHGGPEAQARPGFSPVAQLFVDAGFVVVEPNVRGSDGYGRSWIHADDGAKRATIIGDIEDCAKFIRTNWAQGGKAPKIGVFGGSYGGYSVLMAMTKFAGAYDAGVSVVGISNLLTFLRNTAPYRRALRASEYGDPDKDEAVLRELSPTTYVSNVKAPLLILQGATDPRVPAGEAVQIYRAVKGKGVPVELMIFPDEGHGTQKRSNQVLAIGHALSFFERHLGK